MPRKFNQKFAGAGYRRPETMIVCEDLNSEIHRNRFARRVSGGYRGFPETGTSQWLRPRYRNAGLNRKLVKWSLVSLYCVSFAALYLVVIF